MKKECKFCHQEVLALPPLDFLCPQCWEAMHGRPKDQIPDEKVFMLAGVFMAMNTGRNPPAYTITLCARRLEPPFQQMYLDMEKEMQLRTEDPLQDLFEPRE